MFPMSRRDFMKAGAAAGLAALGAPAFSAEPSAGAGKPNLLILHCDQLSQWALSIYAPMHKNTPSYGKTLVETPNIARLGKEGAVLTNFFTNSAVCTPSRGCFFTGRYPESHGAYVNNTPLNPDEITFGEQLKRHGYDTGYCGKWHLNGPPKPGFMTPDLSRGFDDCRYMFNRGHWKKIVEEPQPDESDSDEKEAAVKGAASLQKMKAHYCGEVKCIDDNVGRILKALEDKGLLDNTIVVFTTDHGDYMGEHGLMGKNQWYRTAYQIPFLIRYPKKVKAGAVVGHFATNADFMPTVLALMGVPPSGREQGVDASAILTGAKVEWKDEANIHHSSRQGAGVYTPEFDLILRNNGLNMLFDLTNDPEEKNNLAGDAAHKQVFDELARKIITHNKAVNPEAVEWLQAAAARYGAPPAAVKENKGGAKAGAEAGAKDRAKAGGGKKGKRGAAGEE
ncbi:MAG: sulfatase-like hydrolase/transferase [Candidatus Sumerlaeota bacterium]|nr:sulfatase-like hydrolase/transferase [Candidatus Sumerlaeota bacterium]